LRSGLEIFRAVSSPGQIFDVALEATSFFDAKLAKSAKNAKRAALDWACGDFD
jgi:hypothetical protein